jgi:hypothetical protein
MTGLALARLLRARGPTGESLVDLTRDGDRVAGVVTEGPRGTPRVGADLVVDCDGRGSGDRPVGEAWPPVG